MKLLTQSIKRLVPNSSRTELDVKNQPFDFVKSEAAILRELHLSQESGNMVGLFSPALAEGMLLIVVLAIESRGLLNIVAFTKHDINGHMVSTGKVALHEIKGICPFIKERRATVILRQG